MKQPACDKGFTLCLPKDCPIYKPQCKHTSCKRCTYFNGIFEDCKKADGFIPIQWNCRHFKLAKPASQTGIRITVSRGNGKTKILSIQALSKDKLPKEYLASYPHCYTKCGLLYLHHDNYSSRVLGKGGIDEDYLQKTLAHLQECGERLAKINKERREREKAAKAKAKLVITTFTI